MSGRWDNLPSSAQEERHLLATTTSTQYTPPSDPMTAFRLRIGSFVREEVADAGRSFCYYRHMDSDQPVSFLCDMGCCSHGCCNPVERAKEYNPYSWALALLAILLITILVSLAALVIVYWVNRQQTRRMREEMIGSSHVTDSTNVSQISGPGSYYYPEGYYPYTTKDPHMF